MEHDALIRELTELESWPLAKRMKQAKKRRRDQLRKWREREDATEDDVNYEKSEVHRRVVFEPSVALLESAARNDTAEVVRLLDEGADANLSNPDGLTALHQCCIDDCPALAAVLLSHGADINARDIEMWTPLHAASRCGNLELVKLLINKGADLVPINSDGQMPYEIADTSFVLRELQKAMEEQGYTDDKLEDIRNALPNQMMKDVEDCIKNNFDLNLCNESGATILHIAAANGFYQVADLLLMHGADVNLKDTDGWTPLHGASCWGQYEIIELLAEYGADMDLRTNDHETPVMLAGDQNITLLLHDLKTRQLERDVHKKSRPHSRTYSTSSRGHSVRRENVTMKSSFSKRDAMAECKHLMRDSLEGENEKEIVMGTASDLELSVFSSGSSGHGHSPGRRRPTGVIPKGINIEDLDKNGQTEPTNEDEVPSATVDPEDVTPTSATSGDGLIESANRERSTTFKRRQAQGRGNGCCTIL